MSPTSFKWQEYLLPLGIVASLLVIFFPLPPMLMDTLLACNICVALIIVLTAIRVQTPLEFSIFPALLLATTLGRLVLNIATTRLILANAKAENTAAAGGIIQGFGEFVSGNSLVIGLIIFSIILIVQFVVITKGATRISEVAARFVLDGMPGKQMAIDADLNAGLIDKDEAIRRRDEITEQADFFSSMDGASKFVRGDAIAGLVITAINIVGGLAIGLASGMSLHEASSVFTKLTIGDGLVSQLPAFLIALAAAFLVTRSSRASNLPMQLVNQIFARPEVIVLAGGFIALLTLASMPLIPTLTVAGGCAVLALTISQKQSREQQEQQILEQEELERIAAQTAPSVTQNQIAADQVLSLNPLEIELGSALLTLADSSTNGDLLDQINEIRKSIASDLGIVLPKVKIRDNVRLGSNEYRIKVLSNVVAGGKLKPRGLIALDTGNARGTIEGEPTSSDDGHPSGVWISRRQEDQARKLGYMVLSPTIVLAHHLRRTASRFADELLDRDTIKQMVEEVRKSYPSLVEELIPDVIPIGTLQSVLKRLLRESVSIRQLSAIMETVGDHLALTSDPDELTEIVRARLSRTLCERYRNEEGTLPVVTLSPDLESHVRQCLKHCDENQNELPTSDLNQILSLIGREVERNGRVGKPQVLLVSGTIRRKLKQASGGRLSNLAVLSYSEIPSDCEVNSLATIGEEVCTRAFSVD